MNVEEILTRQKIPYKVSGKDFVVSCFNPDHDDSNPSMRIDKILGIFHCLSCGYKGNLFYKYGEKPNVVQQQRENLKRKIMEIRQQSIGYSFPADMTPYIGSWRNISPKTYVKFEAFKSAEKEFINRIVFPIRDLTGKITAFMGRDDTGTLQKKYLIHPGGVSLPLYPIVTPIHGRVLLVEGIFDMLNLHDKGLDNAICSFGCDTVKEDKIEKLKLLGVTGVDIMYDADEAGQNGAKKLQDRVERAGLECRNLVLTKVKDPGDLQAHQVQNWRNKLYGESSDS